MMFIYRPQTPSRVVNARSQSPVQRAYHNYDPDEAFVEFKRREYIAALEEAEQRAQFRRELDIEEERHRRALQHIAAQETVRRQHAVTLMEQLAQQSQQADELRQAQRAQRALQERQAVEAQQAHQHHQAHLQPQAQQNPRPGQPSPQEILRRRLERQKEEESQSREFHRRILSDIFGVPVEISESQTPVQRPAELPKEVQPQQQQQAYEPEQPEKEEEPHWSTAPLRNRALAEIAGVNRAFISLKNTFIFPTGQLERVPDSMPPKLAYNSTNAAIHAYEHALTDLLSKLDGIESHGFKGVRMARKQLVVKIEEEILNLEKKIAENIAPASGTAAAAAAAAAAAPAPAAPVAPTVPDVEMAETAAEAPSHTPNPAGYDVEVEDVFVAPTPKTNTDTTTVTTEEQEPIPVINVPEVPSQGPQEYAVSDSDIQMVAAPSASTEQTNTSDATLPTAIPAKHTSTISVSDEEDEDEVNDAVHVITLEDGTKAKAGKEEEYELLTCSLIQFPIPIPIINHQP